MTAAESRLSAEGEYDDTIERTMPVIEAEKEVRFVQIPRKIRIQTFNLGRIAS